MTALVTGFPSCFLATRVVQRLLDDGQEVWAVVRRKSMEHAERLRAEMSPHERRRLRLLEGDSACIDLGLSGREFQMLTREVERIHHCAAVTYLRATRAAAERTNIGGAREVLELAEACRRLDRLVHWSTALVSGTRRGRVLEEDLGPGPGRNAVEETRRRAERIVREARDHVPVTILRPSIVVGDSQTGEIDRLEGPYLLVRLLLNAPPDLRIPMPGRGNTLLNMVPIDFVVDAGFALAAHPRSAGRTFHIVDPDPLPARRVFDLIAEKAQRPAPRGYVPTGMATALMRTPGLERLANIPRTLLEQLSADVVWDDRQARPILREAGVQCPPFEDYVGKMVAFVREQQERRRDPGALGVDELRFEDQDVSLD